MTEMKYDMLKALDALRHIDRLRNELFITRVAVALLGIGLILELVVIIWGN